MIILLDINPHQKTVLGVELSVTEGIIEKLREPGTSFSIITFGSKPPTLVRSSVHAEEAIAAVSDVSLEQNREKYFGVYFYDALKLALDQSGNDAVQKSIVVISEGNDYFPRKTFKETVSRMQHAQTACHAAMVASHSFYGTKGIQRYGFDLRRLVGKTCGQYVEIGGSKKKVPRAADRIAENIHNSRWR
ncbi:MAG TPA: vWA domain-containing protein [Terriglobales bacterium]|nr:vWA domain-containing protein [Terriglobales bacterium]